MNKEEIIKTLIECEKDYGLIELVSYLFGKNVNFKIGFSEIACNTAIEDLALSVRSYNALRRANITTVGDVVDKLNEGSIKSIRNLGAKSYGEIQTKIITFGFEHLSQKEKREFFSDLLENNVNFN